MLRVPVARASRGTKHRDRRPAGPGSPSQIEVSPCHLAGFISRQTGPANFRPHGVDRAGSRDADLSDKSCAAIASASHASSFVIDKRPRDSIEIGVAFQ